ncbi:UNVERIFIED_CONTAM: hypothetical protein GTU68_063087 [Idotea baltica]|nr:hypothetical protein [Idotea baltica]
MKFRDLNLNESLLEAISYMGFVTATPIQEKAIPEILAGKDIMACAQTGTGKTAAFILPVLHQLADRNDHSIKAMIIVPTRELAIQIDQQIQGLAYFVNLESIAVYGGGDGSEWDQQKYALTKGADIIVATPGKLISHLNMGYVKLEKVSHLILDEADRMLDMGFFDDIKKIISFLPPKRQNLMFSATMPDKDVLSRGIDIKDINLVINYDVPSDAEDYVHRIGRTARADTTGVALTLVNEEDMFKLHRIEKLIEAKIMKIDLPEELGEGPAWNTSSRPSKKNYGQSRNKRNSGRNKSRGGGKNKPRRR